MASNIVTVDSVADLATLGGSIDTAVVRGHYAGSLLGGGIYVRDPNNTHDNGGTHIGEWVYQNGQSVTPYHFGAKDGLDIDSGAELNNFFAFWADKEHSWKYAIWATGGFGTGIPLVVDDARGVYTCTMQIRGLDGVPSIDDILTIQNCRNSQWLGRIIVNVTTHSRLNERQHVNGIRIHGSEKIKFCNYTVNRGSGWGLYFTDHNNGAEVGSGNVSDMGASTYDDRNYKVEAVSFTDNGKSTIHQLSTVQLAATAVIPSDAHQMHRAWLISPSGKPHLIRSVDRVNNTMDVYPILPDADQVPGDYDLIFGGGVCNYASGHTAKGRIGQVAHTRCGTAVWLTGSSTANLDGFVGEYSGITIALGSTPTGAFGGAFIGSAYFEGEAVAELVHVNQTNGFSNGSIIGSMTAGRPHEWISLGPNDANGEKPLPRRHMPLTYMMEGEFIDPNRFSDLGRTWRNQKMDASNHAPWARVGYIPTGSGSLLLRDNVEEREWRGVAPVEFILYGDEPEGGRGLPFDIDCEAGYTINGQAPPFTIAGRSYPVTIHALLQPNNNWTVTMFEHQPLS